MMEGASVQSASLIAARYSLAALASDCSHATSYGPAPFLVLLAAAQAKAPLANDPRVGVIMATLLPPPYQLKLELIQAPAKGAVGVCATTKNFPDLGASPARIALAALSNSSTFVRRGCKSSSGAHIWASQAHAGLGRSSSLRH